MEMKSNEKMKMDMKSRSRNEIREIEARNYFTFYFFYNEVLHPKASSGSYKGIIYFHSLANFTLT